MTHVPALSTSALTPIRQDKALPVSLRSPRPDWRQAGVEPSLHDLIADPLTRLVMGRDRLTPEMVMDVMMQARKVLNLC